MFSYSEKKIEILFEILDFGFGQHGYIGIPGRYVFSITQRSNVVSEWKSLHDDSQRNSRHAFGVS